jgi:CheY-like chemotaxis protein
MLKAVPLKDPAVSTRILLVEDNKIDARLMRLALEKLTDWPGTIEVLDDGEKAVKFLQGQSGEPATQKPDLVILDLNLPKRDGTEVLEFIRATEQLHNLLVFIFSSSPVDVAEDRVGIAHLTADGYFEKPNELNTYFSIAAHIRESYWRATQANRRASA